MAFHDPGETVTVKPCSLIICGPGEGQTDQYACAFQDAIRMLQKTWEPVVITTSASKKTLPSHRSTSSNATPFQQCVLEPGCVIPAGGTFEFLLNHTLLKHDSKFSGIAVVSKILAEALLCVPQKIYSHSPRHFLQTQTKALNLLSNDSKPSHSYKQEPNTSHKQGCGTTDCPLEDGKLCVHCCRKSDVSSKLFMLGSGLESVACKSQLLLAVLQCVTSLLRVDAVLYTHTALHA